MSTPSPASPAVAPPPTQLILQQPPTAFGRYGRFLWIALGLAVITILGQAASYHSYFSPPNGPQERFHSLSETSQDKIAIISVSGTILESDGFVKRQIDRVREDKGVRGVVLRINSPGGTVTGSDYLYHHLNQLRADRGTPEKPFPLVVSMGGVCASGGYYIAMAVGDQPDSIFAEPSTWTGSIGVVIPHYDLSGLLAQWQIRDDSVASHPNKLMGSPTRELGPEARTEERALLQTLVDLSFERFKEIVKTGRPGLAADDDALSRATTGQIFTAQQALDLGLVDRLGFLEDAIERVAELADRDPDKMRCIQYDPPAMSLGSLLQSDAPLGTSGLGSHRGDFAQLLDLTVPRAYYLFTWLPSLLSNGH
jgi:protease-4